MVIIIICFIQTLNNHPNVILPKIVCEQIKPNKNTYNFFEKNRNENEMPPVTHILSVICKIRRWVQDNNWSEHKIWSKIYGEKLFFDFKKSLFISRQTTIITGENIPAQGLFGDLFNQKNTRKED